MSSVFGDMSPQEWADAHGYVHYKCPHCGTTFYDDGDPECPRCGEDNHSEEDEQ